MTQKDSDNGFFAHKPWINGLNTYYLNQIDVGESVQQIDNNLIAREVIV